MRASRQLILTLGSVPTLDQQALRVGSLFTAGTC